MQKEKQDLGKHMILALSLSAFIMLLNIIAVTSGAADSIYTPLTSWLASLT